VRPAPAGPAALGTHSALAPAAGKPLAIRLVVDERKPAEAPSAKDAVRIPAGSILRAVFLSGMDAPTGQQARRDPFPALARIKHDAILPNRFRADVRECFLIVAGYGDLPSERAYLRTETITCVRQDGGAIEVAFDGYAVGEDGKAGVRGRVVSKQGALLAKAMLASFVDGFSRLFATVPVTAISTSPGTSTQYQQVLSSGALQGGAVGDLARVDWSRVNLDEWLAILAETGYFPTAASLNQEALTGSGSAYDVGGTRPTAAERSTTRAQGLDIDAARRDAEGELWGITLPALP
jgi:conjugal transfer pilus assembly protein TraB